MSQTIMTNDRIEALFFEARDLPPGARNDFLEAACAETPAVRSAVDALLNAEACGDSLLDGPAELEPTVARRLDDQQGKVIGRYKLLEELGEGGFGVVYMAEQLEPVVRKVALKIIKPGMDSRAVVARFEAERQALAMMDHPHIARVLDGGSTDDGRPFFVMELVKGVSLTDFCDKRRLKTDERISLFLDVCHAVQHAHQKGIVHRDLKPSNVMVTLADGKPLVKVIDFGVARALHQRLTEKTLFTRYGQLVGTPQYMSPEQAEMNHLDVDTRSDIYSLGVLLYELLTGAPPLTKLQLQDAGYAEICRMICEQELERPSTRIRQTAEHSLLDLAVQRSTSPDEFRTSIHADLDWVVMRTLEKERDRRYATANEVAADLRRYLNDEAVEACPPSLSYRFQKYVRRNRMLVAVTGLVAAILVISTGVSSGFAYWAVSNETKPRRSETSNSG